MALSNKQKVTALLKVLETGDQDPIKYIHPGKYIQHNLGAEDGLEGLKKFIQLTAHHSTVNTVRVFEDGDFVFAHTEYDFGTPTIGFDVFRFEDDLIVEHWDNLQPAEPPNPSGHTMTDGATEIADREKTEANKTIAGDIVTDLVNGRFDKLPGYYDGDNYIQHNPWFGDQLSGTVLGLREWAKQGITLKYEKIHRVLGEGNFALVISECQFKGAHSSFYDMYRIANGKIAEHWDTIETIPPQTEQKNSNGKF
jgi:predicted SnoaL-like aldol condensation-catalyzing enzyme